MGKIQAVCISDVRGIAKRVVPEGLFKVDWGIEGDAHAGHWHRQVSLLGLESIEDFRRRGGNVEFGAFGENLVVDGFIFSTLPVGTLLRCGDVLLEITQTGKLVTVTVRSMRPLATVSCRGKASLPRSLKAASSASEMRWKS